MKSLKAKLNSLFRESLQLDGIVIRPVDGDYDLLYAVVECRLEPEQEDYVNPAGFSIGRAYLAPQDHVPCVICKRDGDRIGYIVFRKWLGERPGFNWSYYIDRNFQGLGYGKEAAKLAVDILKAVDPQMPIKLSTEVDNTKAQRLYSSIGFVKSDELDGDDLVFIYE